MGPEVLLLAGASAALTAPVVLSVAEALAFSVSAGARPLANRGRELAELVLRPLRLAGAEGVLPTDKERVRLSGAALGAGALFGLAIGGVPAALAFGIGAAWLAARAFAWRRERFRRRLDTGAQTAALALADALSAGQSIRGALIGTGRELSGPIGLELRRVAQELELGAGTDEALERLRSRTRSRRLNLIVAAVRIQRRAGGSLATLLREIAATIEEHDRLEDEARAASAQARFTSVVVICLPACGLLLGELGSPGLVERMAGSVLGAWLLGAALLLQLAGVLLIRRISRLES